MWAVCILPCLTACSGSQSEGYTVAEWLDKLETDFNMMYYTSDQPYFPNVTSENENYDTVQIAAEWGLVDPAEGIRLADSVTKEFAADTLVAAMAFDYEVDAGISDADKISDLHNVSIAVNEGVFALDAGGKFDPQKKLSREEADSAAAVAYDKWVNLSYTESYNNSVVKEEVINLGGLSADKAEIAPVNYIVEYSGDLNVIDENGNYVNNSTKTITFPLGQDIGIQPGSVLTLPADSQSPSSFAVVVDTITTNSDGSVTVQTHNAELEEAFENIDVQYGGELDLDNAVFYDMQGNRIGGGVISDNVRYAGGSAAIHQSEEYVLAPMVAKVESGEGKIKLGDDLYATFKVKGSSITLGVDVKLNDNISVGLKEEMGLDVDFKVKGLDWYDIFNGGDFYARLAVGTTKKTTGKFKAGISTSDIFKDEQLSGEEMESLYKLCSEYISATKDKFAKGVNELSAPLLMVIVPTEFGEIQLIIRLELSVEGQISFSVETTGKYGLEWNKKKLRPINEFSFNSSYEVEAKAEAMLFLGVGWGVFGHTVIDGGVDLGVGAKINTKIYQVDLTTNAVVQECALPTGILGGNVAGGGTDGGGGAWNIAFDDDIHACVDFKAYPIVKFEICTSSSVIGKFVGGLDFTFMGEDDPFFKWHYESDNGVVESCSREGGDSYAIEEGPDITLNVNAASVPVGDFYEGLKVRTLPKGYSAKDLVFSVESEGVATVENLISENVSAEKKYKLAFRFLGNSGEVDFSEIKYKKYSSEDNKQLKINGISDGVTMLKVSTKDGLYSTECKIMVGNGGIAERTANAFIIETYSLKLVPGGSGNIVVTSAPDGYDMSQVTFSSNDTSVATVSGSGTVTAVGSGQTVITISTTDGKFTAMCMVFVSDAGSSV